jgi:hypothetical protein
MRSAIVTQSAFSHQLSALGFQSAFNNRIHRAGMQKKPTAELLKQATDCRSLKAES